MCVNACLCVSMCMCMCVEMVWRLYHSTPHCAVPGQQPGTDRRHQGAHSKRGQRGTQASCLRGSQAPTPGKSQHSGQDKKNPYLAKQQDLESESTTPVADGSKDPVTWDRPRPQRTHKDAGKCNPSPPTVASSYPPIRLFQCPPSALLTPLRPPIPPIQCPPTATQSLHPGASYHDPYQCAARWPPSQLESIGQIWEWSLCSNNVNTDQSLNSDMAS